MTGGRRCRCSPTRPPNPTACPPRYTIIFCTPPTELRDGAADGAELSPAADRAARRLSGGGVVLWAAGDRGAQAGGRGQLLPAGEARFLRVCRRRHALHALGQDGRVRQQPGVHEVELSSVMPRVRVGRVPRRARQLRPMGGARCARRHPRRLQTSSSPGPSGTACVSAAACRARGVPQQYSVDTRGVPSHCRWVARWSAMRLIS